MIYFITKYYDLGCKTTKNYQCIVVVFATYSNLNNLFYTVFNVIKFILKSSQRII